jgi:hypothetical protein
MPLSESCGIPWYRKICHNNDNEKQHTVFPSNIFYGAVEVVNNYKSIIWY